MYIQYTHIIIIACLTINVQKLSFSPSQRKWAALA